MIGIGTMPGASGWVPLKKRDHWEMRLMDWARTRMGLPFQYGLTDCPMLCFEAIDVMTGGTLAQNYRGQWESRSGALKYMLKHETHLLAALQDAGLQPVASGFHQVGDIIVTESLGDENDECAALRERLGVGWLRGHVCLGPHSLAAEKEGVTLLHTAQLLALPGHRHHILRVGC